MRGPMRAAMLGARSSTREYCRLAHAPITTVHGRTSQEVMRPFLT